jgi:capsid protein
VRYLQPGEDIKTPENTRPGPELANFLHACDGEIGSSIGMPVELVSKDFTKTTWHSARQSSLELERTAKAEQSRCIDQWIRPVDEMVIEDAILAGQVPSIPPELYARDPAGFLALTYQVPVRGLVDPGQENAASEQAVAVGFSTLADECAARGRDWQDVIDQRARELAYQHERGVSIASASRQEPDSERDDDRSEQEEREP